MWRLWSIRLCLFIVAAGWLQGVCLAANWFPLGPFGGDVRSLAADPADPSHHLFLGTATGWIYDSHDGGATWKRVSQINSRNDLAVDHILVDKTNPKRLVVGAWVIGKSTDGGIFVSEDYGKNWYSQAQMRGQSVRSLARSDSDPKELVAGTLSGVFRSQDNGVHWTRISPADNGEIHEVESVAIDPADPDVIYAGTWHLPWKTTDGGASWHSIKDGLIDDSDVFSIIVDPKDPKIVYASACSGIYKSSNSGDLFHKVQGIPSTARRTRKLAEDPEQLDTVFAGTTEGLYRTLDAGAQWERMTPAEVIVNDVYVDPNDSKRVLLATERGGVYRSEDGGTSFEASNDGFSARQISAYAQDAQSPNTLYVGVVNDKLTGGVFQSTDGAVHWQQQSEGLQGRDVFSLLSLPGGDLLAGTAHGIFRLANGTWVDSSATMEPVALTASHTIVGRPKAPLTAVARPASTSRALAQGGRGVSFVRTQSTPTGRAQRLNHPPPPSKSQGRTATHSRLPAHPATKSSISHSAVPPGRKSTHVLAAQSSLTPRPPRKQTTGKPSAALPANVARASSTPKQDEARLHGKVATRRNTPGRVSSTVYALVSAKSTVFAGTSDGLLQSDDEGQRWSTIQTPHLSDVHFLAVLQPTSGSRVVLLAADLGGAVMSPDGGRTWNAVPLPPGLTQIGAVGLDGEQNLWIGGREGVWFSGNGGTEWKSLRNLFLTQVDSLFYDTAKQRMLVTAANSDAAFSVDAKTEKVVYANTGWKLRFVRPVGDHFVAATLFDGMVVQPEMVATPLSAEGAVK